MRGDHYANDVALRVIVHLKKIHIRKYVIFLKRLSRKISWYKSSDFQIIVFDTLLMFIMKSNQ